MATHA